MGLEISEVGVFLCSSLIINRMFWAILKMEFVDKTKDNKYYMGFQSYNMLNILNFL